MRNGKLLLCIMLLLVVVSCGWGKGSRPRGKDNKWNNQNNNKYYKQDRYYKQDKYNKQGKEKYYNKPERKPYTQPYHEQLQPKVIPQQPDVKKYSCQARAVYDSNILVFIWPIEFCEQTGSCNQEWQSQWDGYTPILEGFWPAGSDEYYYRCFGSQEDQHCQQNAYQPDFNFEELLGNETALLTELNDYWSPYHQQEDQEYFQEEWLRHGMCYLMNMIEDNPRAYESDPAAFNRTILTEYFKDGILKAKKLKFFLTPDEEFSTKAEFAKLIGFEGKQDHFNLICGDDNQIDEIHICFNRTRVPGKETTIPCSHRDTCQAYSKIKLR